MIGWERLNRQQKDGNNQMPGHLTVTLDCQTVGQNETMTPTNCEGIA
jgi:hypothetical protein